MEKGTFIITQTKKGFAGEIAYQKNDGTQAKLPITVYRFQDNKLNNTPCTFERQSGTIIKLIDHTGKVLYGVATQQPSNQTKESQTKKYAFPDSFDVAKTLLPKDTRTLVGGEIDNFLLKLNKGSRFENNKFYFFKRERKGDNYQIRADFSKINFLELCNRQNHQAENLFGENMQKIVVKPQWRWVSGLGGESVYETGLSLHHIYGCPYLSGSAIKGLLRSFMITEIWGIEKDNEARAFHESKMMCDIFGCPKEISYDSGNNKKDKKKSFYYSRYKENKPITKDNLPEKQGIFTFFDLYPQSAPNIEVDIMNPHYMEYYGSDGRRGPTDFQMPVPVPFLVVGNHAKFQTYVGTSENSNLETWTEARCQKIIESTGLKNKDTLLDLVNKWLTLALTTHGIGAKTSVGYGYFSPK